MKGEGHTKSEVLSDTKWRCGVGKRTPGSLVWEGSGLVMPRRVPLASVLAMGVGAADTKAWLKTMGGAPALIWVMATRRPEKSSNRPGWNPAARPGKDLPHLFHSHPRHLWQCLRKHFNTARGRAATMSHGPSCPKDWRPREAPLTCRFWPNQAFYSITGCGQ